MKNRSLLRGLVITLLAFGLLLGLFSFGISQVNCGSNSEQAEALRATVLRATFTCYAVEGRYPPDAAYLQAHYGLVYDPARFIVTIQAFADNILPDIAVLSEGEV